MNWLAVDWHSVLTAIAWCLVGYFLLSHGGHAVLALISMKRLRQQMDARAAEMLPKLAAGFETPVSIIVPLGKDTDNVGQFIRSLFNLDYPEFEVIVVCDSSRDGTLARLQRVFELVIFPEAYWRRLPARVVHGIYRSAKYPNLRLIDKMAGGTGDAINAGINAARYPLVCIATSDCVLQRESLRSLLLDFLSDPDTIASASAPRVANGGLISNGFLETPGLTRNLLPLLQVVEGLREILCGQLGWSVLNSALILPNRFCAFRKEAVVQAGGCRKDVTDAAGELLVRLHRIHRLSDKRYRIAFSPAAFVWRAVPGKLARIRHERNRTQRGLTDAIRTNLRLLCSRRGGFAGCVALPFVLITELAGPLIEVLALVFFFSALALGLLPDQYFAAFLLSAVGLGVLVSSLAVMLDALVLRTYRGVGDYILLLFAALVENCGYRQLVALWRMQSLLRRTGRETKTGPAAPISRRPGGKTDSERRGLPRGTDEP